MTNTIQEKKSGDIYLISLFLILFVIAAAWYYFEAKYPPEKPRARIAEPKSQTEYICEKQSVLLDSDPLLMSVGELRKYSNLESINDRDGKNYIGSMQEFCMITYEMYKQNHTLNGKQS